MKTLINPSDRPVVYDREGHTVAGGERVEVGQLDAAGELAVATNLLILDEDRPPAEVKSEPARRAPKG